MKSSPWHLFYKDSNYFKNPASAKQLLNKNDISSLKLLLIEVLNRFFEKKEELHIGLKVYVNNNLRNDKIQQMAAHPPKPGESLETWAKQIFGSEKFGIVLIGLEQYSNNFSEKIAAIIRPLIATAGLPLNGLSFLFFMGNYGFTPFGIHKEATGEDGILLHLGPEDKEFYTWDDPQYNAIKHNSKVFHDIHKMLPQAKLYYLKPGDAMFIPHYVYHVANTAKFSVSIVLDYINPPKDYFENDLLKLAAEAQIELTNTYMNPISLNASLNEITNIIEIDGLKKKLEITLQRKLMCLRSNGGIGKKSNKGTVALPHTESFAVIGKSVFPILWKVLSSEKALVFARGHQITIANNPGVAPLLARLNKGETLTFSDVKEILEPKWDLIAILSFLQELLMIDAVEVSDN
ncbi:MAG: RNA methylase [Aequorivita sp.]|nr:RNA methylase [Aequorivita sp.]|tara:strand:- start:5155 stop:6369 length:1215 start_codon:yes stop_codon:yes gene_type:complete